MIISGVEKGVPHSVVYFQIFQTLQASKSLGFNTNGSFDIHAIILHPSFVLWEMGSQIV